MAAAAYRTGIRHGIAHRRRRPALLRACVRACVHALPLRPASSLRSDNKQQHTPSALRPSRVPGSSRAVFVGEKLQICATKWRKSLAAREKIVTLQRETQKNKDMNNNNRPTETATVALIRGDERAFVVTDGRVARTYEPDNTIIHDSLRRALARLVANGWKIDNENQNWS